jgi:hypothetical protein
MPLIPRKIACLCLPINRLQVAVKSFQFSDDLIIDSACLHILMSAADRGLGESMIHCTLFYYTWNSRCGSLLFGALKSSNLDIPTVAL